MGKFFKTADAIDWILGESHFGAVLSKDTRKVLRHMRSKYGIKPKVYAWGGDTPAFTTSPPSSYTKVERKKYLQTLKERNFKPGINLNFRTKEPHILAHEFGHAVDFEKFPLLKGIVGGKIGPVLGLAAAATLLTQEDKRKYAPAAIAAGVAPKLYQELKASTIGVKAIKGALGSKAARVAAKKLTGAFGTYLVGPVLAIGATSYAVKKLDERTKIAASELKPHQKRVLDKLETQDALLVYHGLGSGKTMTALKASEKFNLPTTIIGPASLKRNFKNETIKHKIKAKSEYYSYAKPPAFPRHGLLVFDEAHRMGRLESKRSRYPDIYSGKKELYLTGTPLRNEPAELIPLLRGLGVAVPRDKKGFNEYFTKTIKHKPNIIARVFRGIKPGTTREAKNLGVLKKLLKGRVDYHAPNTSDYPTVTTEIHKVLMSPVQHETYKEFMKSKPSLRYKIKHGLPPSKSEAGNMNAFLSASRQISNTPRGFNLRATPADAPKLNAMVAQIVKHYSADKNYRGLTYSNYLGSGVYPLSERLTKNKIPHAMFTGKLSDAQKNQVIKDYNTGKIKHLLITGSGAEGLDLKGTKLVQITEPHWNKPLIKQVQGRAVRYKSHAHLPENERTVKVQKFLSVVPRTKFFKRQYLSADQYLSRLSATKQKLNDQFLGVLKEVGQDDRRS